MRKTIVAFGLLILALLMLFQLSKYSIISGGLNIEMAIAVIAAVFFVVGLFINRKYRKKDAEHVVEIDHRKIEELDISKREYEVLMAISEGLSNKEIGEKLFVSESTIKTHVSNLLVKLNAKRRTQAIQIAKELHII